MTNMLKIELTETGMNIDDRPMDDLLQALVDTIVQWANQHNRAEFTKTMQVLLTLAHLIAIHAARNDAPNHSTEYIEGVISILEQHYTYVCNGLANGTIEMVTADSLN